MLKDAFFLQITSYCSIFVENLNENIMPKIKRYEVLMDIPLIGMSSLRKGEVIDSTNSVFSILDKNGPFFTEVVPPKFSKGDKVIIRGSRSKELLVVVETVRLKDSFEYKVIGNNTGNKLTLKEKELTYPTIFWFVNSSGKIISDFEERIGIDARDLEFKKMVSNYYKTSEDARAWIDKKREEYKNYLKKDNTIGYIKNRRK